MASARDALPEIERSADSRSETFESLEMLRSKAPAVAGQLLRAAGTGSSLQAAAVCVTADTACSRACAAALQAELVSRCNPVLEACRSGCAVRALSTMSASAAAQQQRPADQARAQRARAAEQQALVTGKDRANEITDKYIPTRPMGVVEGTSYSLVILAVCRWSVWAHPDDMRQLLSVGGTERCTATCSNGIHYLQNLQGLACCGAIVWAAVNSLLIQPKQYTVFNMCLEQLRQDPRVTVRLGTPISGYGQESANRAARQMIPHRVYQDEQGKDHVQVQFRARGPTGSGLVSADMYQDTGKRWLYAFLYIDLDRPQQRVILEGPVSHI